MPFSPTAMQRARQGRGLTQEELAAVLGCSLEAVRAWEQGKRKPSDQTQIHIARKLRIDFVDLYAPEPVPAA